MDTFAVDGQHKAVPKNTRRANEKAARALRDYLKDKSLSTDFESLDAKELSELLILFYRDVRKRDGDQYKVTSLEGFRYALNRYFRLPPYLKTFDLIKDEIFEEANAHFKETVNELKTSGKGEVTHHPIILDEDLEKLYSSVYFDINTPLGLLNKVQFEIRLYFFRKGPQSMVEMTKKTFQVRVDSQTGYKYMCKAEEQSPRSLKTKTVSVCSGSNIQATGPSTIDIEELTYIVERPNDPNCPVKSFEKYKSKLHPLCHRLWQRPISPYSPEGSVWYRNIAVGRNTLQRFMPELSLACSLSQKYSNHSIRITGSNKTVLSGGYNFTLPYAKDSRLEHKILEGESNHSSNSGATPLASSTNAQVIDNSGDGSLDLQVTLIRNDSEKDQHFVGGNGPTRDHPDPLPVRPMNVLHSSGGYIDAGPSNQVYSGKPENPRRKKIAAATVSSAPVLIPDDSPPQPSPAKIQKKQIDDRRFDEQRFQEQRFQERRFENRRFDDRRQMVNTQVSQMAAKTLQAQMPVQQHMSVAQVSQNITRPVQVLAPPIQISEPKPKPVEKPRPREKRIFVVADHQRCVMSNLASLWKSGKLCDAGIGNGSSTVMVHKVVLSAVCPKLLSVFSTDILSHKFLQVNFPEEVSTEALNAFAEYMYNGLLDIDPDILHQLKIIAKRLDMKEFEQLCDSRLPSTIPHQPASTVTVFGDLSQMQTILSNPPSITVPTVQPSLPSSSITSVSSHSTPSVTTQVIDVKQEISEAELAQVKKDTAAVFGQESEVASLDASKSGNSSGGFVIVPSVKTEPVGPEDDRYGQLNNQSYTSTPVSISSRIPGTGLNSTVVSSSEFVLPFSDTTDSNTTNVLQGTSKLKSNVFESSLVSDLSPVSCIVEKMCSQSSPIREDPSKPLNRTITTQSIDNIVTSGSNEGVYPVGLFTAGGDSLPLSSSQVTSVKNIGLYKTDGLT
ncbi:uncharacterized protein LOC115209932 isoform X1 [Octopus sinensis]|uniref:Uncharacterized protein LOC115209932 isoform X1 n=1 Tax=Octopus sinensis TaxID=2607531 RepID=A0A7E6ENT8_9MOLL|nr:uncharacterized protein LOC115209932 isoform X1 [Octopus sinensis]